LGVTQGQRPRVSTLWGWGTLVFGVFGVCVGAISWWALGAVEGVSTASPDAPLTHRFLEILTGQYYWLCGVFVIAVCAVLAALGWGLLSCREWARRGLVIGARAGMVVTILASALACFALCDTAEGSPPGYLVSGSCGVAITLLGGLYVFGAMARALDSPEAKRTAGATPGSFTEQKSEPRPDGTAVAEKEMRDRWSRPPQRAILVGLTVVWMGGLAAYAGGAALLGTQRMWGVLVVAVIVPYVLSWVLCLQYVHYTSTLSVEEKTFWKVALLLGGPVSIVCLLWTHVLRSE